MQTIYITENGIQLKKRSNRIAVKKGGKIVKEIRTTDLKRILIFGNNQITSELMRFLAGKGIEAAFLSTRGKFQYRLVPELPKNAFLRIAQHDRFKDENFKVRFCKSIVHGKITNQRIVLIRYNRNRPGVDLSNEIESLKNSIQRVEEMKTVDQLRGVEGNASKIYFKSYGKLLLNGFEFKKRIYHPPPDPVNAMLGFGYMLVFNELSSLLEAFGFDVYTGFMHGISYGRKSLASDVIEELRSPITERLVLYLINKGMIKTTQFSFVDNGVKMDDQSRNNFLANYESFMTGSFLDSKTRTSKNFRQILRERVEALEEVIINGSNYRPFLLYS